MHEKKINILMLSPDPDKTLGGMSSVIKNYQKSNLKELVNYTFIGTAVDGNKKDKLDIFFKSLSFTVRALIYKNIDIVHIHSASRGSFRRKSTFLLVAKLFRKRTIMHIHGAEFKKYYDESSNIEKKYIKWILDLTDSVIVLGKEWREIIGQYTDSDIHILHNAIDVPKINNYSVDSKNITVLGRLGERKGTYDIIESIRRITESNKEIKLMLAGDGEIEKVKNKISNLGLENNIKVLGWIGEKERAELLKNTEIYILPSYNEGMPMSILEAMSYGIPIISTNVGSIPTVVENEKNGFIVNPGDIERLTENIKILTGDKNIRKNISNMNYEKMKQNFSIEKNIDALVKIYKETI